MALQFDKYFEQRLLETIHKFVHYIRIGLENTSKIKLTNVGLQQFSYFCVNTLVIIKSNLRYVEGNFESLKLQVFFIVQ